MYTPEAAALAGEPIYFEIEEPDVPGKGIRRHGYFAAAAGTCPRWS